MYNINERIKSIREDLDLKQEDVARALKTTQAQIWKYEAGKQEMTTSRLRQLCLFYNVSADYILGLPGNLDWPREPVTKARLTAK